MTFISLLSSATQNQWNDTLRLASNSTAVHDSELVTRFAKYRDSLLARPIKISRKTALCTARWSTSETTEPVEHISPKNMRRCKKLMGQLNELLRGSRRTLREGHCARKGASCSSRKRPSRLNLRDEQTTRDGALCHAKWRAGAP